MDDIVQNDPVVFGGECCFCGRGIARSGPDPLQVVIEPTDVAGGVPPWQTFWCHTACFRQLLSHDFIHRYGGIGGEALPPESQDVN